MINKVSRIIYYSFSCSNVYYSAYCFISSEVQFTKVWFDNAQPGWRWFAVSSLVLIRLLWLLFQTISIFVFEWCCSILWLRFFCIRPHFWRYSAILRLVHKFSRVSAGMHWWFLRLEKVLLSRFRNCRGK